MIRNLGVDTMQAYMSLAGIAIATPIAAVVVVCLVYAMAIIVPTLCVLGILALIGNKLLKRYALYRYKRFARGL